MMRYLRSLLFYVIMISSAGVMGPFSVLLLPANFSIRYRFLTMWARMNLWFLGKLCDLHYEVEGRENIPVGNGLIFCKHQSAWETLALQQIFPPQTWLLKRELLWVPFFGWGLAMLGSIGIDRSAGTAALSKLVTDGIDRLQKGRWLVIFPEGTRVAPGAERKFLKGGSILAAKAGYPVVPVAHNAGEYWPRRTIVKIPGTIKVVVGPAIDTKGKKASEINRLAEEWMNATMARITDERFKQSGSVARMPDTDGESPPDVR